MTEPGVIRPARLDEVNALHRLAELAYTPWEAIVGRRPLPMDDDYAARVRAGQAWVLDEGGEIAALAVLEPGEGWVVLENVAVHPERQRAGLGQRMIAFAADEARRRGARELRLYTNALMAANLALYARLGFRETWRERMARERIGREEIGGEQGAGSVRVHMALDLATRQDL
jgi:ribosomal protein S18 acetylase RimI-like enzyme